MIATASFSNTLKLAAAGPRPRPRLAGPGPRLWLRATPVFLRGISNIPTPKKSKVWDSVDDAVKDVKSGDIVLCGGAHIILFYLLMLIASSHAVILRLRTLWCRW